MRKVNPVDYLRSHKPISNPVAFLTTGRIEYGMAPMKIGQNYDPINQLEDSISLDQLNPNTPGGAAAEKWAESGYDTSEETIGAIALAALMKGKSQTAQYAAKGAQTAGTLFAGFCAVTPAAPAAPLCGLMGSGLGAAAGILGSAYDRLAGVTKNQARTDLALSVSAVRKMVYGICCSLGKAYYQIYGEKLDYGDAIYLLKLALIELGYKATADNIRELASGKIIKIISKNFPESRCDPKYITASYAQDRINSLKRVNPSLANEIEKMQPVAMWIYSPTWTLHGGSISYSHSTVKDQKEWCDKLNECRDKIRDVKKEGESILEASELVLASFINMEDEIESEIEKEVSHRLRSTPYTDDPEIAEELGIQTAKQSKAEQATIATTVGLAVVTAGVAAIVSRAFRG